jgi:hypothetical protein
VGAHRCEQLFTTEQKGTDNEGAKSEARPCNSKQTFSQRRKGMLDDEEAKVLPHELEQER